MSLAFDIRETAPVDAPAIQALLSEAFPDEALWPVVERLLTTDAPVLSLCAMQDADLIGHVLFTHCRVAPTETPVALLAPVAVRADRRRQGVGGALILDGLRRLAASGAGLALVLGDPAYYSRFGFETETAVTPPYPLPEAWREAWRSRPFSETAPPPLSGPLIVPNPWRDPALWTDS
ncbi:MAG: N-acetyltransferase [Alphaproteobacteria bacterium]|nr:N-acetyltransferase [Alphaproteobacteria bacterium]